MKSVFTHLPEGVIIQSEDDVDHKFMNLKANEYFSHNLDNEVEL
jgi:hypothetical protein